MTRLKNLIVRETRKIFLITPIAIGLVAAIAWVGYPMAAQSPAADPQREKKLDAGEIEAKQLLLLMDRDRSGKVSRQEFMSFMEAEFERLDIDKNGELDVKELTQFRFVPRAGTHR